MSNKNANCPYTDICDLNRIPPVDSNHCDVAAILIELQCLRTEVRALRQLSEELTALRQEVLQLRQLKSEVAAIRQDCAKLADINFHLYLQLDLMDSRLKVLLLLQDHSYSLIMPDS